MPIEQRWRRPTEDGRRFPRRARESAAAPLLRARGARTPLMLPSMAPFLAKVPRWLAGGWRRTRGRRDDSVVLHFCSSPARKGTKRPLPPTKPELAPLQTLRLSTGRRTRNAERGTDGPSLTALLRVKRFSRWLDARSAAVLACMSCVFEEMGRFDGAPASPCPARLAGSKWQARPETGRDRDGINGSCRIGTVVAGCLDPSAGRDDLRARFVCRTPRADR